MLGATHRLVAVVEGAADAELDVALLDVVDDLVPTTSGLVCSCQDQAGHQQPAGYRSRDADLQSLERSDRHDVVDDENDERDERRGTLTTPGSSA